MYRTTWTSYKVSLKSILDGSDVCVRELLAYFSFIGDVCTLNSITSHRQNILWPLSRSHPRRQAGLYHLGRGLLLRHKRRKSSSSSSPNDDLGQSILHLTEALFLPICASSEFGVNIIDIFSELASALVQRSKRSNNLEDANFAIQFLRCLPGQPNNSGIPQYKMMISLIEALGIRAALFESSDGMQDIKDIITTCDGLLDSDSSEFSSSTAILALITAISACGEGNIPVLDQCIRHLREASILRPNSPVFSVALAQSLVYRFAETPTNDDFGEATTILNRITGSPSPGDSLNGWQRLSLNAIRTLLNLRALWYEKPECVEEAISIHHSHSFLKDGLSSDVTEHLKYIQGLRFEYLGVNKESTPHDITESRSIKAPVSKERVDTDIRDLQNRLSTLVPGAPNYKQCLEKLVRSCREKISLTNDPTPVDIREAIKYSRLLLDSIPQGGRSSSLVAINLAKLLKLGFDHTHNIKWLNESIDLLAAVLKVPAGQALCNSIVGTLLSSLFDHSKVLLATQDPHDPETMQAIHQNMQTVAEVLYLAADNKFISLSSRLSHSFALVRHLQFIRGFASSSVTSISTAYERAMSLMQDCVILAPNLHLQHSQLVAMQWVIEKVPLDYASHLIDIHRHGQAIATLERGRALLWAELRGLRTSIQHITGVDPLLAGKFTAINRDLEELTTSVLPSGGSEVDSGDGDPFGRLLMQQRQLLEERNNIISQVRSLPGLQNFLTAPSFDTLRSAASHGPVIIINHSEWRSDILILFHDACSLIPTSASFYDDANRLRDDLLDARKKRGLDSMEYDRTLASILEDLYNLVGRPVIERLHELKIPEQSRVWWCPTSVFCSLPLHAMGPVPSNDGEKRYFSDLYIASYTPTLSALIESRNPSPELQSARKPSLLLVAQPDKTLLGVKGEISVIRGLDIEVESLILKDATTAKVLEGLERHELVHFACHGNLEIGKPFEASFKLHGDQRLKLLDIVNSRLPQAEFAFLSACHTAELTEKSIADEGLHLTAALQYCGFRSVIGTMWAMADTDGRDLARRVYHSMLTGNNDEPCYLRSAEALRDAVRELRNTSGVGLERWVNFVHYGA